MIKRAEELHSEILNERFGGQGEIQITRLLMTDQLQGKSKLFARNLLKPGCSLGKHQHQGDVEAYYILAGEGMVDDNGTQVTVKAGDVVFTDNGESHSLENTGDRNLEFIALILNA